MRAWVVGQPVDEEVISKIPVWAILSTLDLKFWNREGVR